MLFRSENCPIPVKYLDVLRRTYTDIESKDENDIEDLWTDDGAKALSESWRGKTVFTLLKPRAPPGYNWMTGRLNDPENIQTWTPLARNMATNEQEAEED